ncbi:MULTISPECIES: LysR family transcriptional regulator [Chromobacterium]|uniref:LysR family transcriptional regulator n=1 Tax=Chromobacterium rhizoryzae TaxID=1778675 RepID=A0AAD0RW70_9NEIS|nr:MULTISPECIES: LysR family transcriptional regulator [Chromobacterium]AXT49069.1 LysR family transcriptional regulator [Chromobacterium rhizoryzae]OQS31283.1 LysR family transcriptional regulator [Chromobacterium haemolyticum]PTU72352.1 LysR family transcriptional regulator [Chromobacterium haemolyticum]QOD84247.1 LysR family transcriptional regulator [Chromobacterium haemolyticum]BBH12240.1 transcriptional regulator [Chromobacterium haemolyticum]
MNKLEAMQIFVRVAELSSFTQAADSLGLPKASISVAVKQTEAWLGARLLHRTTRKVQMTQDGQAFYERCKDVLAEMDELQGMFQRGEETLSGRLRVDMPSGVARYQVLPRLDEFLQRHPRLELELSSTDRKVDIVREGFDCVLRVGELSDSSLVARPLGRFRQLNCASPAYLARYGAPAGLEDLARHRLVHYVSTLGARPAGWEWRDDSGSHWLAMSGSVIVNNADAYQAACLAGLGLIQAPESGVRHLLDRGELVEVLPEFRAAPMPVTLLYAHRRNLPRRARVFMDWLAEALAPHLL